MGVSGLASGLDWQNIIDQLKALEEKKVDLVRNQQKTYQDKLGVWQTINTKLLSLKTVVEKINGPTDFNLFAPALSSNTSKNADDLLSVTAGSSASRGTYDIVVNSLASAQKISSQSFTSDTTALGLSGDILVNGKTVTVSATDTLSSLANKINAVDTGTDPSKVTASVVHYGTEDHRLIFTSDVEGAAGMTLENGGAPDILGALGISEIQAGADASFTVDGVAVTRSSNTVDDLITGVTLNLKGADPSTTVKVNVDRDYDQIKEQITEFVTAYNDLMDTINGQFTYDTATQTPGGPLFGDSSLRSLRSSLVRTVINQVPGVDPNFSTIGLVGINLDDNGKLTVDDSKLQGYLETNFEDVKNLFVASATSTNSALTYVYHSQETQAGTYNINITGVSPAAGYFVSPGDASGDGETLTGISGDAQGLVVRYSGTATGSIGSLTLTYGLAELLNRSLYQITDSTSGYLPDKQESIQKTIDRYDKTIASMEARVENKMQLLEQQFITMETTLSSLQSESSWLTSQINALSGG
jgi:flagellar hook-associated protein 2